MKILVLAGGADQIALIKELKSRGHIVYLADYYGNPPAAPYSDKHFQISTLDEAAILKLAKLEQVNLITTACTDQALMTVARVSEQLGLSCYITEKMARNVTNKAYMKRKLFEFGIPTAKGVVLENQEDYKQFLKRGCSYPLIVKPCDCNSSKGVMKVWHLRELEIAVRQALILSRTGKVIVEEYKEGEEISIDVWKDNVGVKILSITGTDKIKENEDNFTIYRSKYPLILSELLLSKIKETAVKICDAFQLTNCPLLIQAIINENELNVIEFSARMGGGSKYKLIEYISGIDIMNVYVNRVLGNMNQIIEPNYSSKYMELNYVYTYNGSVDRIEGFDELLDKGVIKEFFQYRPLGCKTEKRTTSSDRILGFLIAENTPEQLVNTRQTVIKNVDIKDTAGKSIMYKKCFI